MTAFLCMTVSLILTVLIYLLQKRIMNRARTPVFQWPVLVGSVCLSAIVILLSLWFSFRPGEWKEEPGYLLLIPGLLYLLDLLVSLGVLEIYRMFASQEQEDPGRPFMVFAEGSWRLKRSLGGFRNLMQTVARGQLILTMIVTGLSCLFVDRTDIFLFALPVSMLWVFRGLSLYLSIPVAPRQQEKPVSVLDTGETKTSYETAVAHLAKTFPEALISLSRTRQKKADQDAEIVLRNLEQSNELNLIAAASYFRHKQETTALNPDYVSVTADLLDRKHVFIRDPFYKDLGLYLALPLEESLIRSHKVLILCQGEQVSEQVLEWVSGFLNTDSQLQDKWKIRQLGNLTPDCQVGILSYSKLFDPQTFVKNAKFLEECEYVILLHPSRVLTTMQISLSVLAQKLKKGSQKPVYCIFDRDIIGLKDTLSHVLKISIQSDTAMSQAAAASTVTIWDAQADFHSIEYFSRQTRYFGGGIDLAAQSVAAGVPSVSWVSSNRFPVLDIMDSAARAYQSVCRVMNTEISQKNLRSRIRAYSSLWDISREDAAFLIVEDEFCNPFAAAASHGSRGRNETAVAVLSEPFLLRDYMCACEEVFRTNPGAIPSLAPAFVRSGRNVLLKLILRMLEGPLSEQEIAQELELAGIESDDPLDRITELLELYTFADPDLFVVTRRQSAYGYTRPEIVTCISVDPDKFDRFFSETLKNVSYVLEDEREEGHVLDTKLYSLITQTILPGQIFTSEGRRYTVRRISPSAGVVLQRASDRDEERRAYRQVRKYRFAPQDQGITLSERSVSGFTFCRQETVFSAETLGYLELTDRGNLESARYVDLTSDQASARFCRHYVNKNVLFIRIPRTDQKVLFQLALMMQELLVTLLPDSHQYLSVTAVRPDSADLSGNAIVSLTEGLSEGVLAVVEDSDMDLGLLDIIEEEFFDLLAVIQDYLRWDRDTFAMKDTDQAVPDLSGWNPDTEGESLQIESPVSPGTAPDPVTQDGGPSDADQTGGEENEPETPAE